MKEYSKVFQSLLYMTPSPSSISFNWNFGSLLMVCLLVQLISGFFLALHYHSSITGAFFSVNVTMDEELWYGWVVRSVHANGASFFFIFIYMHVARGIYFSSFVLKKTWFIGVILLFVLMATAFLGYVLPWGQMSLWGATVITNLLSAIPIIGHSVVEWIWGGFSVSEPTLERFFSIHFILPFIMFVFVLGHILFLHESGSGNVLGVDQNSDKIMFHPYFTVKDLLGIVFVSIFFSWISVLNWDLFMDPDNFSLANPLVTPAHIQPEWYFLFAYAILRSIPNKLGGVVGLVLSIFALFIFLFKKTKVMSLKIVPCLFFMTFVVLSWLGGMEVAFPYVEMSQCFSLLYFMLISLMMWI